MSSTATATAGDFVRQISVAVAFVGVVVVNILSSARKINGTSNADVSNEHQTLFTPAGWAFSIWGLIYAWQVAYIIFQVLPSMRADSGQRVLGWLAVLVSLLNITWSVVFAFRRLLASALLITAMAATLLAACVLNWKRDKAQDQQATSAIIARYYLVDEAFSIYAGWLCVATVANWTLTGVAYGWSSGRISPAAWSILLQAVLVVASAYPAVARADAAFMLPIIVGLAGIAARNAGAPSGLPNNPPNHAVMIGAAVLAAVAGCLFVAAIILRVLLFKASRVHASSLLPSYSQ